MWLNYGVDTQSNLVYIKDVPSGKTELFCPYCGSQLIAKKGKVKQHHFAHSEQTCLVVETKKELPTLPLYDNFHIQLSGKSLQFLQQLWQSCGQNGWDIPFHKELKPLLKARVIERIYSKTPTVYRFTDLGKIPVGALSLRDFNEIQEELHLNKLKVFEQKVRRSERLESPQLKEQLIDLQLYQAQLRRILFYRLYYLDIKADGQRLNKIGVTQRTMAERLVEIERDLQSHFTNLSINVVGTWEHRGNVELYFKHKYKPFNFPIESLTEYYCFPDSEVVLEDLNSMKPKQLRDCEKQLLTD